MMENDSYSELLVHASAAASNRDDEKYRAQALACLGFRAARRRVIGGVSIGGKRASDAGEGENRRSRRVRGTFSRTENLMPNTRGTGKFRNLAQSVPITPGEVSGRVPASTDECGTPGAMSVPLAKSRTSFELRESFFSPYVPTPELPMPARPEVDPVVMGSETESSYGSSCFDPWSPARTIPDSQEGVPELPSQSSAPGVSDGDGDMVPQTFIAESDSRSDEESQPSSPPVIEEGLEVIPQTLALEADPSQDGDPESPSPGGRISTTRSGLSFKYRQKARTHDPPSPSDSEPTSEYPQPEDPSPLSPLPTLVEGPYHFFSPVPETSSNPPTVTEKLRVIWGVGRVRTLYETQKLSQSREIREMERGCWRLDMSGWTSSQDKLHFWNALKDHVTSGRLGWVSVFLDDKETGNVVKVYCFGGIVQHVWAALHILSNKKTAGIVWLDAADKEVLKF